MSTDLIWFLILEIVYTPIQVRQSVSVYACYNHNISDINVN